MARSYRDLVVWQKAMVLCQDIYRATETFPKAQQFVLASQMQRAAISVPSNIAEGYNRQFSKEYRQSLSIAYGSVGELETQILLAAQLGFCSEKIQQSLLNQATEVAKMLHVIITKVKDAA